MGRLSFGTRMGTSYKLSKYFLCRAYKLFSAIFPLSLYSVVILHSKTQGSLLNMANASFQSIFLFWERGFFDERMPE